MWFLVTGQPGSGKTTAVKKIYERLKREKHLTFTGFITEEVIENGSRVGFDVVTIPDGKRGILSRKGRRKGWGIVGKYSVDVTSFEALALPTLDRGADSNTIFILDEIGRMELKSKRFQRIVNKLLKAEVKLIGAITAPIYGHRVPFCDAVAATSGVHVLKLLKATRDAITADLAGRLVSNWASKSRTDSPDTASLISKPKRSEISCPHIGLKPVLELYFKTTEDLPALVKTVVLPLNNEVGLGGVIVTFKSAEDAAMIPNACRILRKLLPSAIEIHTVWSSKFVRAKEVTASARKLDSYICEVQASGGSSVLVVSGTGRKKVANSVSILEALEMNCSIDLGVAFNPFIGCRFDPKVESRTARRCEEINRLESKLLSQKGNISVWLQFGIDVDALEQGLDNLDALLKRLNIDRKAIRVFGSVFIPSKSWIAKMKFRTWSGVYLGSKTAVRDNSDTCCSGYFSGDATILTKRIINIFHLRSVIPVIESSVRSGREVKECAKFLLLCGDKSVIMAPEVKRRRV